MFYIIDFKSKNIILHYEEKPNFLSEGCIVYEDVDNLIYYDNSTNTYTPSELTMEQFKIAAIDHLERTRPTMDKVSTVYGLIEPDLSTIERLQLKHDVSTDNFTFKFNGVSYETSKTEMMSVINQLKSAMLGYYESNEDAISAVLSATTVDVIRSQLNLFREATYRIAFGNNLPQAPEITPDNIGDMRNIMDSFFANLKDFKPIDKDLIGLEIFDLKELNQDLIEVISVDGIEFGESIGTVKQFAVGDMLHMMTISKSGLIEINPIVKEPVSDFVLEIKVKF